MECSKHCFAHPSKQIKEVVVFYMLDLQDGENVVDAIPSMITKLKLRFGLEIVLVIDKSDRPNNDTIMECLVGAISHNVLAGKEWFAFSIDRQTNGVFAKKSLDGANFFDVIVLKGWTNNSNGMAITP